MTAKIERIAIVGAGMIGASWAALAMAHGFDVAAYDPSPEAEPKFRAYVGRARLQLSELGLDTTGQFDFGTDLRKALQGAHFIQENGPEKEDVKRRLLVEVDRLAAPDAIIASSTSALVRSAIVADCAA